jgi:hypothetical protein
MKAVDQATGEDLEKGNKGDKADAPMPREAAGE